MISAAGCITGCALETGSGDEADSQSETSADVAVSPVQRFLDQRYQAADVHHSFKTQAGETIDCVDFFAEPGVKAMAARGTPITAIPHFELPAGLAGRLAKPGAAPGMAPGTTADSVAFRGDLDDDGHARACPDGTVAELRITPEHIARAGGLDAFENAASHKGAPPRGSAP
ncbi:MAG TPA: hypothetical protein VH165_03315, partial [Kofleriaceae bacterium]|nr:hypothetical protein [Kofleriaceae bacterium]